MDTIGGYRLVRRLGSGSRAEVHLGRSESPATPPDEPVAIKLFRPSTATASIGMEAEALARTTSPHLLRLLDLAQDEEGRIALILPRLTGTSVASLLLERSRLQPGEAVTILAPLAAGIAQLHRVGVTHGGIRCSRVLFDDSGAPVLTGFGAATIVGPAPRSSADSSLTPAQEIGSPQVGRDLEDFHALARTVLTVAVPEQAGEQAAEAAERVAAEVAELLTPLDRRASGQEVSDWPGELQDRLFSWSEPLPVGFHDSSDAGGSLPSRIAPLIAAPVITATGRTADPPSARAAPRASPLAAPPAGRLTRRSPGRRSASLDAPTSRLPLGAVALLPEWIAELLTVRPEHSQRRVPGALGAANRGLESVCAFLAPVRPRVWWTAGVVGVLFVVALVVITQPGGADARPSTADASATDASNVASTGVDAPRTGTPARASPHGDPADGEKTASAPDEAEAALIGDAEVAAAAALLTMRGRCLADLSTDCLDTVDQRGSAAVEFDRQVIEDLRSGGAPSAELLEGLQPVLVQRLGDSALLALRRPQSDVDAGTTADEPASLLLVKGSEGWRIRDLILGGDVP